MFYNLFFILLLFVIIYYYNFHINIICSSMLFISVNGPPLHMFPAAKFATSWLQAGRQSALEKATHEGNKSVPPDHRITLFC
jgi:hypothetical protein